MNIEGSVFFITGGASGLGAATAKWLVEAGAQVVLADLNTAAGEALANELGTAALFVHADTVDEHSMQVAIDKSLSRFGRVEGLNFSPARPVVIKRKDN